MPGMTEMKDLLKHELGDLLDAERRFLTATKQLGRETENPMIRERIEQHVVETENQIERLKDAFSAIGARARGERCDGAIGLRQEHDNFKSQEKPSKPVLQAFDLGSGLRTEHYEIAAYRSTIAMANAMGEEECARILNENLKEEEEMARFLEQNAPNALNELVAKERQQNGG